MNIFSDDTSLRPPSYWTCQPISNRFESRVLQNFVKIRVGEELKQKKPVHNGKIWKYEFLRKPDLSISLIHRTLHKRSHFLIQKVNGEWYVISEHLWLFLKNLPYLCQYCTSYSKHQISVLSLQKSSRHSWCRLFF